MNGETLFLVIVLGAIAAASVWGWRTEDRSPRAGGEEFIEPGEPRERRAQDRSYLPGLGVFLVVLVLFAAALDAPAAGLVLGFLAMIATWRFMGLYGPARSPTPSGVPTYKPRRPPIPRAVKQAVFDRDDGRCVQCGSNHKIHFDHIIPFSKGGSDTEENLQILCQTCNLRKGANL